MKVICQDRIVVKRHPKLQSFTVNYAQMVQKNKPLMQILTVLTIN